MDYTVTWSPEALDNFPKAGRVVPELGDDNFRERFIYSYRLIYRIVTIRSFVAVIHGNRLLEPVVERIAATE